jgi:2-methylisocitrate lyase-like PEP mutase family enzyme
MPSQNDLAKHLRSLHTPGSPLILTNVYDAATASIVASLPTAPAVATASYAIAAVRASSPTKPLTVDLQHGYGDYAELADTIRQVIALGAVGCNIEDMDGDGVLRSGC